MIPDTDLILLFSLIGMLTIGCGVGWVMLKKSKKTSTNLISENELIREKVKDLEAHISKRTAEIDQKNVDLKTVNSQLQQKTSELERLHQVKTNLFENISHEFRTPLTLITGPVSHLLKKTSLKEDERQLLTGIFRNTKRLSQLTEQVLDLNRLDTGSLNLNLRKINLSKFVRLVAHSLTSLIEAKGISYELDIPDEAIYVYVDPDKIEKVCYNLLHNAIKFTEVDGKICVEMNETEDDVTIQISDSGIGMHKDQKDEIFNRFTTIGSDKYMYRDGLGIGLSLTKEYLQLHKAKIEVESEFGEGTTFSVTIIKGKKHLGEMNIDEELFYPEKSFMPEPMQIKPTNKDFFKIGKKVLLVEDNDELAAYIAGILEDRGYHVTRAIHGREGLDSALSETPDIIISDIMMPEMNGFELLEKLRDDAELRKIPTIFLTALSDIKDKIHSLQIGVNDYMVKPFDTVELLVRIKNLIEFSELRKKEGLDLDLIDEAGDQSDSQSQEFLKKVTEWIEENLESETMTTESLAHAVAMSRSTLYREIKRITGLSTSAFLKEFRLQYARRLVETRKVSGIKELSSKVGFSNVSYFRDQYINRFGKEPFG